MLSHLSSDDFERADRLFSELIELSGDRRFQRLRRIASREPHLAGLLRRLLAADQIQSPLDQRSSIVQRWMDEVQKREE